MHTKNHPLTAEPEPTVLRKGITETFFTRYKGLHCFKDTSRGPWVAQLAELPTDFRSGHDLTACELEPRVGLCADSPEPGACFRFCVSLSLWPSPLVLCFSLKNKQTLKKLFLTFWCVSFQSFLLQVEKRCFWGAWVAQSVKRPTSAQVMISRFVGSSPASGSVLTARSLELASDSVSPSLSAPPPLTLCVSPFQK